MLSRAFSREVPPGAGLAIALGAALEHAEDLPDTILVRAAGAASRLSSWLEVVQGQLTADLAIRREHEQLARLLPRTDEEPGDLTQAEAWEQAEDLGRRSAIAEVAMVAGLSEYAVRQRLDLTGPMAEEHPVLYRGLLAGRLDSARARLIAEQTDAVVDLRTRMRVEEDVLDTAARLTRPQLRACVERAIVRHDPDGFEISAGMDTRARSLTFRSLGRGMSQMTLTADTETLTTAQAQLDVLRQLADTGSGAGRANGADILLDLIAAATRDPDRTPAPDGQGVNPKVVLNLTVPLSVALGLTDAPAELSGHGLIPAALAREIIVEHGARAVWRCLYVDDDPTSPLTGRVLGAGRAAHDPTYTPSAMTAAMVRARDHTCRFPGCRRQAHGCDLDHVTPHTGGGATCETNLVPLCRHHHRLKTHTGFSPNRDPATDTLTWTTPTGATITLTDEYTLPAPPAPSPRLAPDPPPF